MAAVMNPCLCAHPMHWHLLQAGVCIDGCSCVEFVADCEPDDQKYPIPAPFSNHYAGIYAKKYDLEEPA